MDEKPTKKATRLLTDEDRKKGMAVKAVRTATLKKAMLAALEKSLGVVAPAVKKVKIDRATHYDWYKNDSRYKAAVDAIQEIALDFAETKLHSSIRKGSDTANIFYLKTKGKKRGYIERSELDINGQMAVNWNETRTYGTDPQADPGHREAGGSQD